MNAKLTPEQRATIRERYIAAQAESKSSGIVKILAEEYGVSRWTITDIARGHSWQGDAPPEELTPSDAVSGRSVLYDADGKVKLQWVKTKTDPRQASMQTLLEGIAERIASREPVELEKAEVRRDDILAVYPLGDPHIGLLASLAETGERFDLYRGEKLLRQAITRLVASAPPCEEALLISLGDFFHSDLMDNVTQRSKHPLDVSHRWHEVLEVGMMAFTECVELCLRKHGRVKVICAIGNHDDHSALFMQLFLAAWFRNEPRVEIVKEPTAVHYHRFGRVLIGVHHGHTIKKDALPYKMSCDRPEDWARTKHRYWLTGHIHHDSVREYDGEVKVESFRTLVAKDNWTTQSGYSSGRDAKCILYHRDHGEIERHTVSVEMIDGD